jgi:NADH-quinone oxidoreductase subunit J
MALEQILFFVFAILGTICALGLVIFKDPVHCALSLVLTFFNIAGIYILLGAEFLAAVQVLVYAGAILVLFLFVIMLLRTPESSSLNPLRFFQSRFGPILALGFLVEVILVVFTSSFVLNGGKITNSNNTQAANVAASASYSVSEPVPMVNAAGKSIVINDKTKTLNPDPPHTVGHPALLGKELYSTYLFPFEISSLILLIAAIGAIVIARRSLTHDPGERGRGRKPGGFITLVGATPGSPQALEIEKKDEVLVATGVSGDDFERKVILKK